MSDTATIGRYGPLLVERAASGPNIGYVIRVSVGDNYIFVRTSERGTAGLSVETHGPKVTVREGLSDA